MGLDVKKISQCMARFREHISMDSGYYVADNCTTWHDKLADPYANILDEDRNTLLMSKQWHKLKRLLNSLDAKEKEIIAYMYGLVDGYNYTGADLGRMMGISRERVRQIKATAFEKLGIHPGKTYLDKHQKPKYWIDKDETDMDDA